MKKLDMLLFGEKDTRTPVVPDRLLSMRCVKDCKNIKILDSLGYIKEALE